ncbi:unnamed protein product [Coffea canephora]|uniref:ENT domain-containing protein n=1 Tax=Coffea canephora TaxID=49390 RepID=A0A068U8D1_COFCA|nr:unnamed protein product [Coffea canephora]
MRFKRGSKVEVMNKKEVPISWRSAEILNGNGHTYYVRYEYHPVMNNRSMMERVSRKFVRPCPLPSQGIETWKVGDTVEVFEDFSWKIATILTVMQGDYYTVRLLGSSKESNVHKLNIREQWLWLDDKWILMGKKSGACGVNQVNKQSSLNYHEKTSFQAAKFNAGTHTEAQKNCLDIEKRNGLQEFHKLSRSLKRLSQDSSCVIESLTGKAYKIRAVEKDYRKQKVAPPSLVEKVDLVASPKENLGEINVRASVDNRMIGYNEPKRENLDGAAGSYLARSLESRDSESSDFDSDASSVGSCSVNSERQKRFPYRLAQIPFQVTDSVCSDAESFCGSTDKEESCSLSLPLEEEVATSIHNLELHAYRCTLEALHASGPLSWDQETLLTNLRMMLHISNDEHLMELRNLLSGKTGAHCR